MAVIRSGDNVPGLSYGMYKSQINQLGNKQLNVVFFGTHDFAATILEALIKAPAVSLDLVITQPDRPIGRQQQLQKSPVKLLAEKYQLKVEQPASLKAYNLKTKTGDVGIVAQYGLIIPRRILDAPRYGTLNVHASLLPKYRGASPIQSALIKGETETGITIIKMDDGLDTGPILRQEKLAIDLNELYPAVEKRLTRLGAEVLLATLPLYVNGTINPQPQNDAQATTCGRLTRAAGRIDWNKSAPEIYNLYRGLTPWPGVWTTVQNQRLKLLQLKPIRAEELITSTQPLPPPGRVQISHDKIYISCRNGWIEILALQLEGKKALQAPNFVKGHSTFNHLLLS